MSLSVVNLQPQLLMELIKTEKSQTESEKEIRSITKSYNSYKKELDEANDMLEELKSINIMDRYNNTNQDNNQVLIDLEFVTEDPNKDELDIDYEAISQKHTMINNKHMDAIRDQYRRLIIQIDEKREKLENKCTELKQKVQAINKTMKSLMNPRNIKEFKLSITEIIEKNVNEFYVSILNEYTANLETENWESTDVTSNDKNGKSKTLQNVIAERGTPGFTTICKEHIDFVKQSFKDFFICKIQLDDDDENTANILEMLTLKAENSIKHILRIHYLFISEYLYKKINNFNLGQLYSDNLTVGVKRNLLRTILVDLNKDLKQDLNKSFAEKFVEELNNEKVSFIKKIRPIGFETVEAVEEEDSHQKSSKITVQIFDDDGNVYEFVDTKRTDEAFLDKFESGKRYTGEDLADAYFEIYHKPIALNIIPKQDIIKSNFTSKRMTVNKVKNTYYTKN